MKTIKRITVTIMALAMIFALGVNVAAATMSSPATYSITVKPKDKATHTYEAFQVFTGSLQETSEGFVLSNIEWGANFTDKGADLISALQAEGGFEGRFAGKLTAADIAEVLGKEDFANNEDMVALFADVVGKFIKTNKIAPTKSAEGNETSNEGKGVVIDSLTPGYYFVWDKEAPKTDSEGNPGAFTEYILQLLGDITLTSKSDVPTVDKKIIDKDKLGEYPDKENEVTSNTANVGDHITYELTSKVPDMVGYKDYYFVFDDKLSKGLTFDGKNTVTVTIGDTELHIGEQEAVEKSGDENTFYVTEKRLGEPEGSDGTQIRIVIHNFLQYSKQKGDDIVIRYTATLNENAVIGDPGNPNEVKLEFSNNPNADFGNDKDEYEPNEPKGETPIIEVRTYTGKINVEKVDKNNHENKLTGAKFQINGYSIEKVLVKGYDYKPHSLPDGTGGEYYKLVDGTYTKEAPNTTDTNANNSKLYDSTTQTYDLVEIDKIEGKTSYMEASNASAFVNSNGVLTFEGINDGVYVVTELIAPEGYNKIDGCYVVVVDSTPTDEGCTWNFWYKEYKDIQDISDADDAKNLIKEVKVNDYQYKLRDNADVPELSFIVENSKGIKLPETGGIGTTVFYIVGGGLLIAAFAVLVSKILTSAKPKSAKPKSAKSKTLTDNI